MPSVSEAVASWEQRPFARGSTDCCAFCNHVLYELTGVQRLPDYDSDETAQDIIWQHGSLEQAVTYYMGAEPVFVEDLKPGDIVLVDIMGNESIGILMPQNTVAVVFEYDGLREIRADFIDKGWSVGR